METTNSGLINAVDYFTTKNSSQSVLPG